MMRGVLLLLTLLLSLGNVAQARAAGTLSVGQQPEYPARYADRQ